MLNISTDVKAALGQVPIRMLSDKALRLELAKLRAIRKRLASAASPEIAPAPAMPLASALPRVFKRVPLSKGSIFTRRVPVEEPAKAPTVAAVAPRRTQAEIAAAERLAALTAGLEAALYDAFLLRFNLLSAEQNARTRKESALGRKAGRPIGKKPR